MKKSAKIIDQVLEVSEDYLGPAAERFIDRQILTHLEKPPDKITKNDLDKLIDWIKLSFALLTDNSKLIDDYAQRLSFVAHGEIEKAFDKKWRVR